MYSRQQVFFLHEISSVFVRNEGKFTFWFCVLFFCLYKETLRSTGGMGRGERENRP